MRRIDSTGLGLLVGISMVMTAALSGSAMATEPAAPPPAAKAPASWAPADSSHVKDVQQSLLAAGYDPGPVDGIMGPRTKAALRQYIAVPPPQVPDKPNWTLAPSPVSQPRESQ